MMGVTYILIGAFLAMLIIGLITAVIVLPFQHLRRRLQAWVVRVTGGVPWLHEDVRCATGSSGAHTVMFVSRHALAEGGLECPLCRTQILSGDFSRVWRTMVDGRENEVAICPGKRTVEDGRLIDCRTLLAASPDTEHGDHLNDDGTVDHIGLHDPDEFYRFRRAPADQYLREHWGVEASDAGDGKVDVPNDDPKNSTTAKLPAVQAKES